MQSILALLTLAVGASVWMQSAQTAPQGEFRAVPKATCGPQDRQEITQGRTTLAERFAPGPSKAYSCNLELVGQYEGDGSGFGMNAFGKCAYYSTWPNPGLKTPGVPVLDVSDPQRPRLTTMLNSKAMLAANESLEIHPTRKILLANEFPSTTFDLYDLSADCRFPVLKSSVSIPRMQSHSGKFTTDGLTFYTVSCCTGVAEATAAPGSDSPPPSALFVIDVSDVSRPRGIGTWIPENKNWLTHSASVNKEGTRAYVALTRMRDDRAKAPNPNGLVILDVSDFQLRRANPRFRVISTYFWDDVHFAQYALPVTIKRRPFVVFTDLTGAVGIEHNPPPPDACKSGRPGHGFPRIIDIADEAKPKTVSKLMLEVSEPANCATVMHDPTVGFQYGSTQCDVDDPDDAKLLACGYTEGGLRVFDIRDPYRPREVAYFKPRARRTESRQGAPPKFPFMPASATDHTADQVISPRFSETGREIWFNSFDNGFHVVRFSERLMASEPGLFPDHRRGGLTALPNFPGDETR